MAIRQILLVQLSLLNNRIARGERNLIPDRDKLMVLLKIQSQNISK